MAVGVQKRKERGERARAGGGRVLVKTCVKKSSTTDLAPRWSDVPGFPQAQARFPKDWHQKIVAISVRCYANATTATVDWASHPG